MVEILSTVWGESHIKLFQKTALKSLNMAQNREALIKEGARWNIFTDDIHQVIDMVSPHEAQGLEFKVRGTELLRDYIDQVQSASIWQMEESIRNKSKVLLAPPDTIFGEGSVANLIAAGSDEGSVVVVPHPRVLPSILDETADMGPYIAWKHLHDSWVHAERNHPDQSSYIGGVEWQRIGSIIQGTHRLPSPYLINFTPEDVQYFKSAISFGNFDHKWAGDILIHRGRQRYLGSSDAAFIVEITEADKNVPPIHEGQPRRGFWQDWPHNKANAQILFTFRLYS